ncbi:ABC transporter permease [Suttonella indologenes]|uniref:Autoinducer 2 import system permease protein lsrD n=1 Tax=Suttonella indologenes TaxID=13276 RepID=A0A380MLT6_9GAMM|nr:ABC transporter permease [Suttonella indologenes]SUO92482.1 Autoinducer 2 import system permease protein lsrD [Suttonella indologenes]
MSTTTPNQSSPSSGFRWSSLRDFVLVPPILLILLIGHLTTDNFLTWGILKIPIEQATQIGILVLAQAMVIIIGRMDLSLESTFGLAPAIAVWAVAGIGFAPNVSGAFLPDFLALPVVLLVGAAVGLINAVMIVKFRLNGFIVTLGMLTALRGLQTFLTGGASLYQLPKSIAGLAHFSFLGMSLSFWVFVSLAVVLILFMQFTRHGRALYAVGGNAPAAKAAGIQSEKVIMGVLIAASLMAALAGVLYTSQYASVGQSQGSGYIFTVFAACVIGGISLNGGRGSIFGAVTGILLLKFIDQLLRSLQVSGTVIEFITGTFILFALIISRIASGKPQD